MLEGWNVLKTNMFFQCKAKIAYPAGAERKMGRGRK
jgi:hypothetical protein